MSLSGLILNHCGWKISNSLRPDVKKCVVIVAPHTSTWDFIIGRLAFNELGLPVRFLIKKEYFFFPMGAILKRLGAIPVDRKKGLASYTRIVELLQKSDSMYLTITPEGTRKYTDRWKKGFYIIAQRAEVPVALAFIDYKRKRGGIEKLLAPTGNYEEDFAIIEDFYRGRGAKNPERFNLSQ